METQVALRGQTQHGSFRRLTAGLSVSVQ